MKNPSATKNQISWVKQLLTQLYTGILSIISKVKAKKNLKVKLQRASTHI